MTKQRDAEAVIAFAKTIQRNVIRRFPNETREERRWRLAASTLVRFSALYDAGLVPSEEQSKYDVLFDEIFRRERIARYAMVQEKCRKEFARLKRRPRKKTN